MSTLLWNPEITHPTSSTSTDLTWIVIKKLTCSNLTEITFKAGSKDYALSNTNIGGASTELGLKKKYRYCFFNIFLEIHLFKNNNNIVNL